MGLIALLREYCLFYISKFLGYSYSSLGCWRDKGKANSSKRPRALDSLEGTSDLLDGKFRKRTDAIEKCAELANSLNLAIFAVSRGGECLGSSSTNANFEKYGEGSNCKEGKGGNKPRSMDVYALETGKRCFVATLTYFLLPSFNTTK